MAKSSNKKRKVSVEPVGEAYINASFNNIIICGGGRKNKVLIDVIQKNLTHKTKINMIEDYGINGDFVESMAFAFLAIRSYKK